MVVTLAAGDWNLGPAEVEAIARLAGAEFVKGHGVDNAITDGAEPIEVRPLAKHGSDHRPVLFVFRLPTGEEFRLLTWNVYVAQAPAHVAAELCKMVDHYQPPAVCLQEAYRCRRVLGGIPGYRRIQGLSPLGEARDCAVLVRLDLTYVGRGMTRMRERWVGPKHGLSKRPRIYPRARVKTKGGQVVRLMSVHLPFGAKAVAESIKRIVAWFN